MSRARTALWRSWSTGLLRALLDPSRKADYAVACAFAIMPAVCAWVIGAHQTVTLHGFEFTGYWTRPNWMGHILVIPGTLFLFRWSTSRIAPVYAEWPPPRTPEIIDLIDDNEGRRRAYQELRRSLCAPWILPMSLLVVGVMQVLDVWEVAAHYVGSPGAPADVIEKDWSVFFVATPDVSLMQNAVLVITAYTLQFFLLLVFVLFITFVCRHNLFFLRRIYQARHVAPADRHAYICLDFDDINRCFGLRKANDTFGTQVLCLTISALGALVTRLANSQSDQTEALYAAIASVSGFEAFLSAFRPQILFHDAGQMLVPAIWLLGLVLIAMPALVKLLPRLPFYGSREAQRSILSYLREYIPDDRWPYGDNPTREEVDGAASAFAESSFWPTGNNRAAQLFFFSFWVFLILLFPLVPQADRLISFLVFQVALAGLSAGATALTFKLLNWPLSYVDVRLAVAPASGSHSHSGVNRPGSGSHSASRAAVSGAEREIPGAAKGRVTTSRQAPRVASSASDVRPGDRIGTYAIDSLLGEGGMGRVFRARDLKLGREVAIKVLPSGVAQDPERLARFDNEARHLASLNHPNIATLFTFDQIGDNRYLVMELVSGETLAARLTRGRMPATEILRIAIDVTGALAHAHAQHVVHRDLKPGNIMLTPRGVKLLDFGLAKSLRPGLPSSASGETATTLRSLTSDHAILGTLHYISPEQLDNRPVDARTDLFSLGAVLYEMATGTRAFAGDTAASVMGAILHVHPPPVSDLVPDVHPDVDRIISRCLAKAPQDRHAGSEEVLIELQRIQASRQAPLAPDGREE